MRSVGRAEVEPSSGEAAIDDPWLVLDFLQAVIDDLQQVGQAGEGDVGQIPSTGLRSGV